MPKILNCFEKPVQQNINPADILAAGPSTAPQFHAPNPAQTQYSNNSTNAPESSNLSGIFHIFKILGL